MKNEAKIKEQLISELAELRQRITELEALETEYKQGKEALRQSEERYRTLFETKLDGVMVIDETMKPLLANQAAADMFGFSSVQELLEGNPFDFIPLEGRERVLTTVTKDMFADNLKQVNEFRVLNKAGKEIWISAVGAVIEYEDKLAGLVSLRDITEHKQAERELKEAERRLAGIVDGVAIPTFVVDKKHKVVRWNTAIEALSGVKEEPVVGTNKQWLAFYSQERPVMADLVVGGASEDEFVKYYQGKYKQSPLIEGAYEAEDFFPALGENGRWLHFTAAPVKDEAGEVIAAVETLEDITERKQAEELFRVLSEISPVGIYIAQYGKFQFVNSQFQRYTGYSENELLNMGSLQLVIPEDRDLVRESAVKMLKGKHSSPYECRIANKRGEVRWILETVTSVQYGGRQATLGNYMDITERKQAEEALRQSEERYRTILEEMEDSYFETDLSGHYTFFNDSLCRSLGYSREELLGASYRTHMTEEDAKAIFKAFNQIYRTGKPNKGLSYEVVRKDGSTGFDELAAFPLRSQEGKIIGFRGIGHDITERKQMEEALRQSEERYRTILEEMEDSYFEVDLAGNYIFANDANCRAFGCSREELLGASYRVYMTEEDTKAVFKAFNQIYRTGKPIKGLSYEVVRKDGSTGFGELAAFPLRNQEGKIIGFRGVGRDVTERKAKEEEYRAVIRTAMNGFWQTDMRGRFLDVNEAYCRLIGYRRDELLNMAITDVEAIEKPEETARRIQKIEKVGYDRFETRHRRKDGDIVDVEVSVNYLPTGDGLMFVFVRDITGRKKAEEERRQLERKAQLASRLATVGEMASGIAHEINNPLTGVIGYAQLLMQRQDIPEDVKKDLKVINDGGQRVAGIVSKLLTFARQHKPQRDYVSINDLIANTLDLRAYELKTHNIKVITHLDPELPGTIADSGQLQQVFLNLIVNAETEMELAHGKGKLSVKTEKIDNAIRISFKDDGPGIAKENIDKIFNPFFTTREVGEGTGLGLSMCHGIIAEHNGRIYAESKLGKGATFVVELPVITKPEQLELAEPEVEEAEEAAKAKILVVDDEPTVLSLVSHVLTDEGHEVETIDNADDALEMIEHKRYSLILLDIKMPGMSGIELYKRIQKIAPSLARRIVFITGDVIGARTTAFLARTKVYCIMKPFDAEQLKRAVNRILTA